MAAGVLLIDSDARARARLVENLGREGFRVEAFGAWGAACRAMRPGTFGCAIVDVLLDDTSGLEAVAALRRIDPRLPVIVTAAENTRPLEAQVRDMNVLFYYVKGFDEEELLEAVREALGSAGRATMKKRILVIDDDADYQDAVRTILESGGYEVVSAYSKDEGQQRLAAEPPDLIILDIMMDRLTDGFHFLYEMRSDPKATKIPVLSVTAVSERTGFDFRPKTDGDYFPADDYLTKPVTADVLLARVGALLGRAEG